MKTDREKAEHALGWHKTTEAVLEDIQKAIVEARLEGAKMMQEKAAWIAEQGRQFTTEDDCCGGTFNGTKTNIANAIRALNPSEVVKNENLA